jgi:hypothetical protein
MTGDAAFVGALILIGTTSDVLAVGHHFIIAIGAIAFTVANPTAMDTCDSVVALIFRLNASRDGSSLGARMDYRTVLKSRNESS